MFLFFKLKITHSYFSNLFLVIHLFSVSQDFFYYIFHQLRSVAELRKIIFYSKQVLKGQCHEIFDHFFDLGPIWTDKNGFVNFFVFAKIFDSKDQKSGVRLVTGHPKFSLDTAVFKFLNYCYWMCKHTQIHFFAWLFL